VSGRLVPALIGLAMTGTAVAADVTPAAVAETLRDPKTAPFLLDVRTTEEFAEGRVPGARNVPVRELEARLAEVPKDRPVVVYCHSGSRAALASRLLRERGYTDVREMTGSMMAWEAAKLPVER
jgi:phage shock protein E